MLVKKSGRNYSDCCPILRTERCIVVRLCIYESVRRRHRRFREGFERSMALRLTLILHLILLILSQAFVEAVSENPYQFPASTVSSLES